jgi:hypothetical protein
MKLHRIGTLAVLFAVLPAALATAATASAAPATVNVRIEGTSGTVFEGPVTTDAKMVTTAAGGTHLCDGTQNAGAHPPNSPGPTPTTALDDAALAHGFTWDGQWNQFGSQDFFAERIGSDGVVGSFDPNGNFWYLLVDRAPAQFGGCQIRISDGDTVLYEWQDGSKPNLDLSAPATAQAGQPVKVTVQQYSDASGTLSPASGASVGGQVTDANGQATLAFPTAGTQELKATLTGAIRSNAADICVYATSSSECAPAAGGVGGVTIDKLPPSVALKGIRNHKHYRRHHGPRKLAGRASDAGGLFQVYFRLRRFSHGSCQWYSAKRSVFTRARRHCKARFQHVGAKTSWSYLLPERLPRGSYTLETKALDKAFNAARTRVEFKVAG